MCLWKSLISVTHYQWTSTYVTGEWLKCHTYSTGVRRFLNGPYSRNFCTACPVGVVQNYDCSLIQTSRLSWFFSGWHVTSLVSRGAWQRRPGHQARGSRGAPQSRCKRLQTIASADDLFEGQGRAGLSIVAAWSCTTQDAITTSWYAVVTCCLILDSAANFDHDLFFRWISSTPKCCIWSHCRGRHGQESSHGYGTQSKVCTAVYYSGSHGATRPYFRWP
jgi:hypothetical protein